MRGIPIRHRWIACAAALTAAVIACPGYAADLKSARAWAGPEYTRLVFDLSGPARYSLRQDTGRVVLEIADSRALASFVAPTAQGVFRGLDSERSGAALRLTAQVAAGSKPKSFVLKPSGDAGYRLVLDLYPGDGAAVAAPPSSPVAAAAPTPASAPSADTVAAATDEAASVSAAVSGRRGRASKSSSMNLRQVAAVLQGERKVVVAIDAGHGGKDTGARGATGTYEKNVTLAVARDLAAQINKQPGMQAVLTRDGDFFIPLERRYQIAREHNADMFVSVHADAFVNGDAKGSSVWVLSSRGKSNEAARWLADRENRADLIGGVSLDDKNDNLAAVLLDLQQGYAMQASESIAGNVLKALGQLGPTHRGYVERANFVVLRSPDVPSILVETAFITNPAEERKLKSPEHQHALAEAVMGGVRNYFESTPPPGSWFAAQAARRSGASLASTATGAAVAPAIGATTKAVGTAAADGADDSLADDRPADADVRDLHRVGRGESLHSIARQYGVSIGALKSANKISSNAVQAGTVLAIPAG